MHVLRLCFIYLYFILLFIHLLFWWCLLPLSYSGHVGDVRLYGEGETQREDAVVRTIFYSTVRLAHLLPLSPAPFPRQHFIYRRHRAGTRRNNSPQHKQKQNTTQHC